MTAFVDDRYKIHIYLDTNILVDYVEQNNALLNASLEYLSDCPFVILRSSHYVEYEMTEVRKKRLFYYKVYGHYPSRAEKSKISHVKQNWCLNGKSYSIYQSEIIQSVKNDFLMIENNLGVRFEDHVLHDKLIHPTQDLCLSSKLSREDSMVMISCVHPRPNEILDFSVLLTNDSQFVKAFDKNQTDIKNVIGKFSLNSPLLVSAKQIDSGNNTLDLECNTSYSREKLSDFWNRWLLKLIFQKHSKSFMGHTIKVGNSNTASELVFVDIEDHNKELLDSEGLIVVFCDLSGTFEIGKDFDYWDNHSSVQLPHTNNKDTTYSFKPSKVDVNILKKLQKKGHLIFYMN